MALNMLKIGGGVLVLSLAACTIQRAETSAIEYNYVIANGKANGIAQVFDLGPNTVVQMRGFGKETTSFLDSQNSPIAFRVMGENIVLAGKHPSFTVATASAVSQITRRGGEPIPQPVALAAATPTKAEPSSLGTPSDTDQKAIAAEIMRIKFEIAELKSFIASVNEPGSAPTLAEVSRAPALPDDLDAIEPEVVIVSFPNNGKNFTPRGEQKTKLTGLAKAGKPIEIRGYTDATKPTAGSRALARARAESARRYLIAMGALPDKISIDYLPAGGFIADNGSPQGRAANRRVEIIGG